MNTALERLQNRIVACRLCPRLVEFRERVARSKRRAYRDWEYWGRPVPSLGGPSARLLILGLAPAAHGANRTGRLFTGDKSGDWLYSTLHEYGFCNRPESRTLADGLRLRDAWITAALHCVPPGNRPKPEELENCRKYLREEIELLENASVVVVLGRIAWQTYYRARRELGQAVPRPRPPFRHGAETLLSDGVTLLCSYHPSRQNTQTGRLSREMFRAVFSRARDLIGHPRLSHTVSTRHDAGA